MMIKTSQKTKRHFPEPIERLARALGRLPGIGPKSAMRLVFHILKLPRTDVQELVQALTAVKEKIRPCRICGNPTEEEICGICRDTGRECGRICVVEEPQDVMAFERLGEYRGLYHVLYGALSPLDGINPDDLRVRELIERMRPEAGVAGQEGIKPTVEEVILATSSTVEGEATAMYLARLIKPMGVAVTRLASGIPVGSDIEYTDEVTLAQAFEGRRVL